MVCKKLSKGVCKVTKRKCRAKYMTKMRHYKSCKHYNNKKIRKIKRRIIKKKRR